MGDIFKVAVLTFLIASATVVDAARKTRKCEPLIMGGTIAETLEAVMLGDLLALGMSINCKVLFYLFILTIGLST